MESSVFGELERDYPVLLNMALQCFDNSEDLGGEFFVTPLDDGRPSYYDGLRDGLCSAENLEGIVNGLMHGVNVHPVKVLGL